jgi:D-glycero-D-manno-heptose 1,7-bisphosphate phosphatase
MTGGRRTAVFLDRDGTLIEEVGYLNHIDRIRWLPRSAPAVRRLNERGLPAILVTNQSGVARRIFDMALLRRVHETIEGRLAAEGARLDGIYVCPHHPDGIDPEYRRACDCRKPRPGLFVKAAADHGVDLSRSYLVGDSATDMEAARNAGVTGVLVMTGYGRGDLVYRIPERGLSPAHAAEDLLDAVEWILAREAGGPGPRP